MQTLRALSPTARGVIAVGLLAAGLTGFELNNQIGSKANKSSVEAKANKSQVDKNTQAIEQLLARLKMLCQTQPVEKRKECLVTIQRVAKSLATPAPGSPSSVPTPHATNSNHSLVVPAPAPQPGQSSTPRPRVTVTVTRSPSPSRIPVAPGPLPSIRSLTCDVTGICLGRTDAFSTLATWLVAQPRTSALAGRIAGHHRKLGWQHRPA